MKSINFEHIVRNAWQDYDNSRLIEQIIDISARVSTNHVYLLKFYDDAPIIAKISYFGKYEHFLEDHALINTLSNNLTKPFNGFLSRSLMKGNELYTYRHHDSLMDIWVVFYNPIDVKEKPPKILNEDQIKKCGEQLAKFHLQCKRITNVLPPWSKTMKSDIKHLLEIAESDLGKFEYRLFNESLLKQTDIFFENMEKIGASDFPSLPVFVDWNIGNFSVDDNFNFYSRWDYDWFRMAPRVMDFYFFSRVCSSVGDKTYFSYLPDPMMEKRFMLFLKAYHKEYPLTEKDVRFLKEAYRFFILNYVIKDGRYFFHELYASRLQQEAFTTYLPGLDDIFKPDTIMKALEL